MTDPAAPQSPPDMPLLDLLKAVGDHLSDDVTPEEGGSVEGAALLRDVRAAVKRLEADEAARRAVDELLSRPGKMISRLAVMMRHDKDVLTATPIPPELDVRKIMINVIPGPDGEGVEIYAKNVAEIEELLGLLYEQLLEAREQLKQSQPRKIVP